MCRLGSGVSRTCGANGRSRIVERGIDPSRSQLMVSVDEREEVALAPLRAAALRSAETFKSGRENRGSSASRYAW